MPLGTVLTGLSPTAAAALAATGALALTGLYLLRRRPTRVVVPFAPLWFRAGDDRVAERRARRLRRLLSLALQLGIFALLVLAAADPKPAAGQSGGRTSVILVDRSASMRATDEPGSRLDRARTLARAVIDEMGPDDRALVAAFAANVTAASGVETDRARLKAAVDSLQPSDEPGDLDAALAFAAAVLRGQARPTVVLVSDGAVPDVVDARTTAVLDGIDVRFLPVGRRRDNLAIVAFSARRLPADPSSVEATLVVQSFRTQASDISVAVTTGPQRIPIARRSLHLASGARAAVTLSDVPVQGGRLEAVLENASDDLPLDDRATAVVPEPARLNVLVVGEPNLFLDGALLGMGAAVHVERAHPADIEATRGRWAATDVVIFDCVAPEPPPAPGRFLYLDPHGRQSPWPDRGTLSGPVVTDVRRDHPLLKQMSLADLNVAAARRLILERDDIAVVSALRDPLVIARTRDGSRAVAVAFDVRHSDLPLRPAFPLFLANALTWLSASPASEALSWPTGRTVRVDLPTDRGRGEVRSVDVVSPDGSVVRTPVVLGGVTLALDRAGVFDVLGPSGRSLAHVAANLASPDESDLAPRPTLKIAGRTPPPPDSSPPKPSRDLWLVALLIALCTSVAEWATFHRRLTV